MNILLGLGMTLSDMKDIDKKKSRSLALEAIHAEWAKDYHLAQLRWKQALVTCRLESELLCANRADTCRWLSTHRCEKPESLFDLPISTFTN